MNKVWCVNNKVSSLYFEDEDDAKEYASHFTVAVGVSVCRITVIPKSKKKITFNKKTILERLENYSEES